VEQVKQLSQVLPSKDDLTNIDNYLQNGGDIARLGPAERFAMELNKVPQIANLLQAFSFKLSFEPKKIDIKPAIETLKKASKELAGSQKFAQLLEYVLEVGNFVNENTPRGGTVGFKYSSLLKIADTKSTDNSMNLLQFIVTGLQKESAYLLTFYDDFPNVAAGARVNIGALAADVNTLQKDYTSTRQIVEGFPRGRLADSMMSFLDRAKEDIDQIVKTFKYSEDAYSDAVNFYGESPKEMGCEEFFGTIVKFNETIQEIINQNKEAVLKQEKEKRREEAKLKAEEEKKKRKDDEQESMVDEVFGALKGGEIFKNRRENRKQDKQVMDSVMGTLGNISAITKEATPAPKDNKKDDLLSIEERRKQRDARKKQQETEEAKELEDAEKKRIERRKRLEALRNS